MDSYIVIKETTIKRQEGDTGSIAFILPEIFDLTDKTFTFVVKTPVGNLVFEKTDDDWQRAGQEITAQLAADDTKGFAGNFHRWELQMQDDNNITTLAKGTFQILTELIQ